MVVEDFFPQLAKGIVHFLRHNIMNSQVHKAFFQMKPLKVPEIDGLYASFFQSQWSMVGPSICEMERKVFEEGLLDPELNRTLITLIPKVLSPGKIKEFRPISLCATLYKNISKVLSSLLKKLLPRLIHPNQASFVGGHNINDNTVEAQEVVHSIRCKHG